MLPTLCVHIPSNLPQHINKADILHGTSVIEVLGGNHTRQVLTELQYSENVPVVIYAGLINDQALYLGYEHNRLHHSNTVMTFEEDVILFRKTGTVNPLSKHIQQTPVSSSRAVKGPRQASQFKYHNLNGFKM